MRTTILEEDLLKMFELRPEGKSACWSGEEIASEKEQLQRPKEETLACPRKRMECHRAVDSVGEREWVCVEAGRQQFML